MKLFRINLLLLTFYPLLIMFGSNRISVYRGYSTCGTPAYTIEGNRVYRGYSTYGTPAFTIDGNRVYDGYSTYGTPAYTIDGNRVYRGYLQFAFVGIVSSLYHKVRLLMSYKL